jgi:hypothetical protein
LSACSTRPFSLPREVLPTLGGVRDAEIVRPLPHARERRDGSHERGSTNIVGRLKDGRTFDQARAELGRVDHRLRREHPDFYPANSGLTFDPVRSASRWWAACGSRSSS